MRAWILTEGSLEWGMGHLRRCHGLDQALRSRGTVPSWLVVGDGHAAEVLEREGIRPALLSDWELPSPPEGDLVVVDSYHAPLELYRRLASSFAHRIWIDDQARLDYPAGHVVSPNPLMEQIGIRDGRLGRHILSGFRHQILRKEFGPPFDRNDFAPSPRSILVLMGGTDPLEVAPGIAARVRARFPQASCRLVVPRDDQRARWAGIQDGSVILLPTQDAAEMRSLMERADLCVCAGGQTLLEAVRMGLPSIAVEVASNQASQIKALTDSGAVLDAGRVDLVDFDRRLEKAIDAAGSSDARRGLSRAAVALVDGHGADRILDAVLQEECG